MRHTWHATTTTSLLAFLLCVPFARAQENANINGTATDSTGAVVPNAAVKLVSSETGDSRVGVTNGSGIFNFLGFASVITP